MAGSDPGLPETPPPHVGPSAVPAGGSPFSPSPPSPTSPRSPPSPPSAPSAAADAAPAASRRRRGVAPWLLAGTAGVVGALVAGMAYSESIGWSYLAQPVQKHLSHSLQRELRFGNNSHTDSGFALHLLGEIRLDLAHLRIANAPGMGEQPLLDASQLALRLHWSDLLAWWLGARTLALQSVDVQRLDLKLLRGADGRDNWTLGAPAGQAVPAPQTPGMGWRLGRLALQQGRFTLDDTFSALQLEGEVSVIDGAAGTAPATVASAGGAASAGNAGNTRIGAIRNTAAPTRALQAKVHGQYRAQPVKMQLQAGSPLALAVDSSADLPVTLSLQVGRASLDFDGSARAPFQRAALKGRYRLSGPSLAAVGEPLGLALPATQRFAMSGTLDGGYTAEGQRWSTVVDQATVGGSRLNGTFEFDKPNNAMPMLRGRLSGPALLLQDLGPAVGTATEDQPKTVKAAGRVLPDQRFDLPKLRAMNADVLVSLDKLDFGTPQLQAASPLQGRLQLNDGVLSLDDLVMGLALGRISGRVGIDGRGDLARWTVDLRLQDVHIERWLRATQRAGQPPYASGLLGGQVQLQGEGPSTAALLASADGRVRLYWTQGTVSHLLVEAAGLDLAQSLGLLITGDSALPVQCGALDLQVQKGRGTPQVMIVDTADSTLWIDGSLSLGTEQLALVAHAQPKDWSPLSLRAPLHIDGTLGAPELSLDKPKLVRRLVPAALLALVNPLLGLLPLMDRGQGDEVAQGCRAVIQRYRQASSAPSK